jgi:hypothetical protein
MPRTSIALIAFLLILNLSGCTVLDGDNYHYDDGDLVSDDGGIRYVDWCKTHPRSRYCDPAHLAVASAPDVDESE